MSLNLTRVKRHRCFFIITDQSIFLSAPLLFFVVKQAGFERVFVPPCPGDEGIAVGCAAFGWHQQQQLLQASSSSSSYSKTANDKPHGGRISMSSADEAGDQTKRRYGAHASAVAAAAAAATAVAAAAVDAGDEVARTASPFWGKEWSEQEVDEELEEWEPWVDVRPLNGLEEVAEAIAGGQVVGWFQGRGEFGPRALGSRSLLADPRDPQMPARINTCVKKR